MQLHEWFQIFLTTYEIGDPDENEGAYRVKLMIESASDPKYRSRNYNGIMVLTLPEFAAYMKAEEELTDFVYDKKTGYVLINFRYNALISHELFIGHLYHAITNADVYEMSATRAAELYIDQYGFFKSSASHDWKSINVGNNFVLTPEAKITFKKFEFHREDMS